MRYFRLCCYCYHYYFVLTVLSLTCNRGVSASVHNDRRNETTTTTLNERYEHQQQQQQRNELRVEETTTTTTTDLLFNQEKELFLKIAPPASSGLLWQDLSVQHHNFVLHNCSGFVPNGHVCGILGPSGAGKSTFLHALTGSFHSNDQQQGHVWRYHHHHQQEQDDDNRTLLLSRMTPQQVAWLQQHDSFFELLTVQETLQLAAFLELPHWDDQQRNALIQSKLQALGLQSVAHRRVGSYHQHHQQGNSKQQQSSSSSSSRLSGGERRRLAVALELLTNKDLLLADEATTGLDSTMSIRVMQLIRNTVQSSNIPAFCILHQPRSTIWNELLDDIILVASGGYVCYAGPRPQVRDYFDQLGYKCPQNTNPAEFYVDLISIDPEDPAQAEIDKERIQVLAQHFQEYQQEQFRAQQHPVIYMKEVNSFTAASKTTTTSMNHRHPRLVAFKCPRWLKRWTALLQRSWRQNIRDTTSIVGRFCFSVINAWLLTQLYPTVVPNSPATAHSLADRAALLTTAAMVVCSMAYLKTAELLEQEYPVVVREQMRQQYSTLEYLLAKAVAELPFDALFAAVLSSVLKLGTGLRIGWWSLTGTFALLTAAGASLGFLFGSWFAADGLALQAGLPILVVLMLVGVINPSGVDPRRSPPPIVAQLLKRISPLAYAIHAVMIEEFQGMEFVSSGPWSKFKDLPRMGAMAMVRNGNQVLDALGLSQETYSHAMKHLAMLTGINLILSWCGLWFRQSPRPKSSKIDSSGNQPPIIRRFRL